MTIHAELTFPDEVMTDLAPTIYRQRLVIEGICADPIDAPTIRRYLTELSQVCSMNILLQPVTHRSERYGWAGWVHWDTSGAHFYAWEEPRVFFSVDIYTCKPFNPSNAVEFTAHFFAADEIVSKGF